MDWVILVSVVKGILLSRVGPSGSSSHTLSDCLLPVDTYRTQDHADDPSCPHISVHSPPNAHHRHSIACAESLPFLSDGKECTLELLFDGDKRLLRGYLHLPGEEELDLWEVEIPRGEGRDWYVGVTGSCGGLWQKASHLDAE